MHCGFQLLAPGIRLLLGVEETLKGYFLNIVLSCLIFLITCRAAF